MEWWLVLVVLIGGLLLVMSAGLPVAFAFLLVTTIGAYFWWGGEIGLHQLGLSIFESLTTFAYLPIPLFILMGEVLFFSGTATNMIDAIDNWLGRLPGRLGLLAVGAGVLLSVLTGLSSSSCAILAGQLTPEMEKRGYKKPMSLGPILGSGGLALMIPPSALAVFVAAVGQISIGRLLIAIIIPGVLMAVLYATYIIIRCWLQPSIAPPYEPPPTPLSAKILLIVRYVLPVGIVIFLVTGVIFLGIATPSEAAATGAVGSFLLATLYRKLNWEVVKKTFLATIEISIMMFVIIASAKAFSQILAFSGATRGLISLVTDLPLAPILLIAVMQVILIFLGMFIPPTAVTLIAMPFFMPIIYAFYLSPVWFGVLFVLNLEMGVTTPPYGMNLFVMKSLAPPDTTMGDCIRAALPFLVCDSIVMIVLLLFPSIVLWLPGLMS